MAIKNYKQLTNDQQALYNSLGNHLEQWAKDKSYNTATGIYAILEVLITLSLSMKALYLIHAPNKEVKTNEIRASDRPTNPTISDNADKQA